MKIKVAQYVANFLAENQISHVFTVTGGGAMHLNDALGHHSRLTCVYNHHEQASAIAAEAYARIDNKIAALCVTTGPGGTNAITGVVGAWLDSIPMLIISGQVRYDTTRHFAAQKGVNLRQLGDQEFNIIDVAKTMTKYCEMLTSPEQIRYCLEKALFFAKEGRFGPCWIDIPVDIQGALIETDTLKGFTPPPSEIPEVGDEIIEKLMDLIKNAKRPVIYAGNGIRLAGAYDIFLKVVEKLGIPVALSLNSFDQIPNEHAFYAGRAGTIGERGGNFAVQNSDLLINIGNRLDLRQIGYNFASFARCAYKIMVDIDAEEMRKPTLNIDLAIHADAKDFLQKLWLRVRDFEDAQSNDWATKCRDWQKKYPSVRDEQREPSDTANVYAFAEKLGVCAPCGSCFSLGNGSASVVLFQALKIKAKQRVIAHSSIAAMGYGFPAAIGLCYATGKKDIICIDGDGSFQMNIQEIQTVVQNKLPIKIFIINNGGYHSIRQSQTNLFKGEPLVGIGVDSFDLSFPDLSKLAPAYGLPYVAIKSNEELDKIADVLQTPGYVLCEVFVTREQMFEPKNSAQKREDGSLYSAPLEDLYPFLPRDELAENMFIQLYE